MTKSQPLSSEPATPVAESKNPTARSLLRSMSAEVTMMREVKANELAVVLKPDSGTEIVLRLTLRDGRIEAQARCERGDFAALNSNWESLQKALSHEGVRLAPLEPSLSLSGGGGFSDASRHSRPEPNSNPQAVAEPLRLQTAATRPANSRPSRLAGKHLLESWA